jgi:hypothetical protein
MFFIVSVGRIASIFRVEVMIRMWGVYVGRSMGKWKKTKSGGLKVRGHKQSNSYRKPSKGRQEMRVWKTSRGKPVIVKKKQNKVYLMLLSILKKPVSQYFYSASAGDSSDLSVRLESESSSCPHSLDACTAISNWKQTLVLSSWDFAMNNKASPTYTKTSNKCGYLFPYFPSLDRRLAGQQTEGLLSGAFPPGFHGFPVKILWYIRPWWRLYGNVIVTVA